MCKLFLSYISPLVLYLKNEHSTKSSAFVDFEVQITRSVIEGYFLSLALGLPLGAKIWENRGRVEEGDDEAAATMVECDRLILLSIKAEETCIN